MHGMIMKNKLPQSFVVCFECFRAGACQKMPPKKKRFESRFPTVSCCVA